MYHTINPTFKIKKPTYFLNNKTAPEFPIFTESPNSFHPLFLNQSGETLSQILFPNQVMNLQLNLWSVRHKFGEERTQPEADNDHHTSDQPKTNNILTDRSIDSSSIDPLPDDTHNIDLPMALCKDKHSCTEHPIQ